MDVVEISQDMNVVRQRLFAEFAVNALWGNVKHQTWIVFRKKEMLTNETFMKDVWPSIVARSDSNTKLSTQVMADWLYHLNDFTAMEAKSAIDRFFREYEKHSLPRPGVFAKWRKEQGIKPQRIYATEFFRFQGDLKPWPECSLVRCPVTRDGTSLVPYGYVERRDDADDELYLWFRNGKEWVLRIAMPKHKNFYGKDMQPFGNAPDIWIHGQRSFWDKYPEKLQELLDREAF